MASRTAVRAYGAQAKNADIKPMEITRRAVGEDDVDIEIKYSGICHSDISQVKGEWGRDVFPMVPGHEIVGIVKAVGSNVTGFSEGQRVGVGCLVDSCQSCHNCTHDDEQYCSGGPVFTYNDNYKHDRSGDDKDKPTYGGYSNSIVVNKNFVVNVPENLDFAGAAPLLCAGITTYEPLIRFGLRPNHKLAVAGLGGLGHMAVKFGKAFGAHVTVLSRSESKREAALELGADAFVITTDEEEAKSAASSFDMIVDTIGVQHDVNPYINMLALDGTLAVVGVSPSLDVATFGLIGGRRRVVGSLIGGIKSTQEMLDFCGRNNIVSDIELIKADQINEAYDRALKSDVKYRFVIDASSI